MYKFLYQICPKLSSRGICLRTMDGNGDKKIFIDEAAKLSGWSEDTLRKWCQRGRIVCEKLGIKWIVVLDINNNIKPLEIKPKGREAVNG